MAVCIQRILFSVVYLQQKLLRSEERQFAELMEVTFVVRHNDVAASSSQMLLNKHKNLSSNEQNH